MIKTVTKDIDRHKAIQAEISKLLIETSKINASRQWPLLIAGVLGTLGIIALIKCYL